MRALLGMCLLIGVACNDPVVVSLAPAGRGGFTPPRLPQKLSKLDLLFVIDNSASMADKQKELARHLPALLREVTAAPTNAQSGHLRDVHVGVITSSLGSHGTSACAAEVFGADSNDRAHLLPRPGVGCAMTSSALTWTFGTNTTELATAAACVVASANEQGCGYEAPWEALYHFLVDPAPYAKAEVKCSFGTSGDACGNNKIMVEGIDEEILAQRKAFLRQDSMLAIVMLSDENDASLKPAGLNWLPWGYPEGEMKRGWGACANVPDEFEPETAAEFKKLHDEYKCFSCFEDASDPNCKVPWEPNEDDRNLRAFNMTQRFGYNFLWGRQRYVDAFTKGQVFGSDNKLAANPVFQGGFRSSELIVVAAIVGAPETLIKPDMSAEDWDRLIGPVGKGDPRMIESVRPRDGAPFDRAIAEGDDLQYACATSAVRAYPGLRHLRIVKDLGVSGFAGSICDIPSAMTQVAARIRDTVQSRCMRSSLSPDPSGRASCAIVEVLADGIDGRCEAVAKGLCTPGAKPCRVDGSDFPPVSVETAAAQLALPISVTGADGTASPMHTQAIAENGNVYVIGNDEPSKKKHLVCEVAQLTGDVLQSCIDDPGFGLDPATAGGWCYSQSEAIVGERCRKLGAPGTVRYLGGARTRDASEIFLFCSAG
jgi:hypothetical protein